MSKKGILLIQLGTPDTPSVSGVRRYLKLFLSDKRVIDIPAPIRYMLLYGIILPIRSKQSAKAYQAIWTKKGSPLRTFSESLCQKLQSKLSKTHVVTLGMRYGKPCLEQALAQLSDCDEITILPLYPQYAESTTASSIEAVFDYFKRQSVIPSIHFIREFYSHPAYIKAQAQSIKPYTDKVFDHLLLSYHGLPTRHIKKSGCNHVCEQACPAPKVKNQACYRAQCFETSRLLARALSLKSTQYTTAFQSRLGKTPWIEPYTDECLKQLAQKGVKNLLVACPAFVADCLETLEEIGIRANKDWQSLGGTSLTLIPCLNDENHFVDALEEIIKRS